MYTLLILWWEHKASNPFWPSEFKYSQANHNDIKGYFGLNIPVNISNISTGNFRNFIWADFTFGSLPDFPALVQIYWHFIIVLQNVSTKLWYCVDCKNLFGKFVVITAIVFRNLSATKLIMYYWECCNFSFMMIRRVKGQHCMKMYETYRVLDQKSILITPHCTLTKSKHRSLISSV